MGTWAPARPLLPPTPGATPPPQAESGFLSVGEIDRKTKSLTHLLMDPDTERAAKKAIAGQVGEHEAERERLQEAFSSLAECANSHRPQVQRPILSVRSCRPPGGSSGRPLRPPGYEDAGGRFGPRGVAHCLVSTSIQFPEPVGVDGGLGRSLGASLSLQHVSICCLVIVTVRKRRRLPPAAEGRQGLYSEFLRHGRAQSVAPSVLSNRSRPSIVSPGRLSCGPARGERRDGVRARRAGRRDE